MIESLYAYYLQSTGVSTDTRSIKPGQIFIALNGPNFNANKFAEQALEKGALLAVVDDQEYVKGDACFLVEDCLKTLQELSTFHRRKMDIPFIGITGSNGKTTTKELTRDVLAKKYKVLATKGNLNNHIGVPLTLLSVDQDIEIAIIEMGANHQGEIAELSRIAEPTHGLITNIGKAHLEGFGGIEGVFKGKTELYSFMGEHGGTLFVNSANQRLFEKANSLVEEVITMGGEGSHFQAKLVQTSPNLIIEAFEQQFTPTITGEYNFDNILVALCIGHYFGVSNEDAIAAVVDYVPDNNRSQLVQRGDLKVILDAYNANPTSMAAALESIAIDSSSPKTVILGDMYELGDDETLEHRRIGEITSRLNLDKVMFVGELMKEAKRANENAQYFQNKELLHEYLTSNPLKSGALLIKGSRGMGLETLMDVI